MIINGTGCSLVDNLYSPVDFSSAAYKKWQSGPGNPVGLTTGGLVFGDELEKAAGIPYSTIISEIAGAAAPVQNIGGPSIVALIHMSQVLSPEAFRINFYGARSDDETGRYIRDRLGLFNLNIDNYIIKDGNSPFTDVLSDPSYNNSNGERSFINYIGAAGLMTEKDFPPSFFRADMMLFGGTALTPGIHDDMTKLIRQGKDRGSLCFVNTVYDFRNQNLNPEQPWPIVDSPEDFPLVDMLIADNEEAVRISGCGSKKEAAGFFLEAGVHSGLITHGCEEIVCFSDGTVFSEDGIFSMPVSEAAGKLMREASHNEADTTGCGDNFAGGVYASAAQQFDRIPGSKPSLKQAAAFGAVSGGFAGLYLGGVYYESRPGEKLEKLRPLMEDYTKQTGVEFCL